MPFHIWVLERRQGKSFILEPFSFSVHLLMWSKGHQFALSRADEANSFVVHCQKAESLRLQGWKLWLHGLKIELATTDSICSLMELVGLLGEAGQDMTRTETLKKLSLKYSHLAGKWWARFQNLASIFMPAICRRMWVELIGGGI